MTMGQQNQQLMMTMMQQDQRLLEIYMAAQGMDVSMMSPEGAEGAPGDGAPPAAKKAPEPFKKEEPPPPEDLRMPEQKEADEFKTKGNELYKKKEFQPALEMYDK